MLEAVGWSDAERSAPLRPDAVFRLASMTKLITAVAVLQLVDDGIVDLDAEVAHYLPDFGRLQVLVGFIGSTPVLRAPRRQATVRELLAHTSGLSYEVWNPDVLHYQELTGTPSISSGKRGVLETPLVDDPGARVEYGTGFDWAAVLVEKVGGRALDEHCARRIFSPLGMARTSLGALPAVPPCDYVPVLRRDGDGGFVATDLGYPEVFEFVTGGGCFFSTAEDYLRLQRTLLSGGVLDEHRILSESSVVEILSPQTGHLRPSPLVSTLPALSSDVPVDPGVTWGFGALVNSADLDGRRRAGSAGWWGIFNTAFWIDPRAGLVANLFMQFVPFYEPAAVDTFAGFERAVYAHMSPRCERD